MTKTPWYDDWRILVIACLTLGLTPYFPEPHIWGKLRWVAGGAKGMELVDWWDLIMHGTPWLLLLIWLVRRLLTRSSI